jgi:hypothetical protein
VRAIQRTQFRAKNVKNDLNPTDLVKRNFCFETEGVHYTTKCIDSMQKTTELHINIIAHEQIRIQH